MPKIIDEIPGAKSAPFLKHCGSVHCGPARPPVARLWRNSWRMSTSAQIAANRANSQLSTSPKTETGKAAVPRNNIRHVFAGSRGEHRPVTPTEEALVQAMAKHYWLRNRALSLEAFCFRRHHRPSDSRSTCAIKPLTNACSTNPSTTC